MEWQLAQINIGKMLAPLDSPVMAEFKNNLDNINALAESSNGFVWRLKDEANNATSIRVFDDDFILVNLSVWESMDALYQYVYETGHVHFLKRRKEWFEKMGEKYMALWYVPEGCPPTVAEAKERLEYLRKNGETPFAFGFRKSFSIQEAKEYLPVNER